jgi:zinc transport system ATP-binding protein
MNPIVIELRNVNFSYGRNVTIRNAGFTISKGDFLGIIGPNGGGKTTLLRLILGINKPDSGTIRLLNDSPLKTRYRVGYIPQETNLNKGFPISVHDVVLMGLTSKRGIGKHFTSADHERADSYIEQLGLSALRERSIADLSGGQRQKVLLARAIVAEPEILFLDEPTASVDTTGEDDIYEYLRKINNTGTTIILVTHNIGVLSKYIKSVACVNKDVHFHADGKLDDATITKTFGCSVDLIAHGFPHRVFHQHECNGCDHGDCKKDD